MSDSEQFSNRFELDLISLLVNFSCELGQIMNYNFWQSLSTLLGQLYAEIVKKLPNSFWASGLQEQNLTFLIWKWPLERFNQIYLSICDLCHPKETPCQKKLLKRFWDWTPPLPLLNLDGQTDGRTDRRTFPSYGPFFIV